MQLQLVCNEVTTSVHTEFAHSLAKVDRAVAEELELVDHSSRRQIIPYKTMKMLITMLVSVL